MVERAGSFLAASGTTVGCGPVAVTLDEKIEVRAWQTLFITSVSILLVAMDVTIVSVALPGITASFPAASSGELAWIFTAYNITFAALLLIGGKVGDRIGRK